MYGIVLLTTVVKFWKCPPKSPGVSSTLIVVYDVPATLFSKVPLLLGLALHPMVEGREGGQ